MTDTTTDPAERARALAFLDSLHVEWFTSMESYVPELAALLRPTMPAVGEAAELRRLASGSTHATPEWIAECYAAMRQAAALLERQASALGEMMDLLSIVPRVNETWTAAANELLERYADLSPATAAGPMTADELADFMGKQHGAYPSRSARLAAIHQRDALLIAEARKVVWHPQGTAPTDGRLLWVSDGVRVWYIRAHRDGSHNNPEHATLCKFWANAYEPEPPVAAPAKPVEGETK